MTNPQSKKSSIFAEQGNVLTEDGEKALINAVQELKREYGNNLTLFQNLQHKEQDLQHKEQVEKIELKSVSLDINNESVEIQIKDKNLHVKKKGQESVIKVPLEKFGCFSRDEINQSQNLRKAVQEELNKNAKILESELPKPEGPLTPVQTVTPGIVEKKPVQKVYNKTSNTSANLMQKAKDIAQKATTHVTSSFNKITRKLPLAKVKNKDDISIS